MYMLYRLYPDEYIVAYPWPALPGAASLRIARGPETADALGIEDNF